MLPEVVRISIEQSLDAEMLLEALGAKGIRQTPRGLRSTCPIHDGQNTTSFWFNTDEMSWYCFSEHCGRGYERNVFNLVYLVKLKEGVEMTEDEILAFLRHFCSVPIDIDVSSIDQENATHFLELFEIKKWLKKMRRSKNLLVAYPEDVLHGFIKDNSYLEERNLAGLAGEFEILFSPTGLDNEPHEDDFPGRIIFPIRDDQRRLVGISGRLATDDKKLIGKYGKYRHSRGFKKNLVLYNFFRALPYIKKAKKVVLVEGFFDVMRLWSYGIKNVVSPLGTSLSKQQVKLLVPYVNDVVLMFDADRGGRSGLEMVKYVAGKHFNLYTCELPEGKDPDDLSQEEVNRVLISKMFCGGDKICQPPLAKARGLLE